MAAWTRGAGLEALVRVIDLDPDLHGRAVRVGGGADDDHLALDLDRAVGQLDGGLLADLDHGGLRLRNVDARHDAGDVHDRRRAACRCSPYRRGTSGRSATTPLIGLRTSEYATCASADSRCAVAGFHLRRRGLDLLLLGDGLQSAQMLLGGSAAGCWPAPTAPAASSTRRRARAPSWKSCSRLSRTFCAASACLLGGRHIGLRLDHRLRERSTPAVMRRFDSAWSSCAFALGRLRGQVAIFEDGEKLALLSRGRRD